jgi:hypothetical protein
MQRSWSVKDRPLGDRCITYGSPQLTAGYQSYYQIVETASAVMIMTEMFHDVRVVRVNNRPHPPEKGVGMAGRLNRPLGRRHASRGYDLLSPSRVSEHIE